MLLVVRVLLLVEVPQTVGLVHKRFPSLLVQLFPPAIKTFKRVPSKLIWDQKLISFWVLVEIHLLSPFLLILPPLVPWHSTEPCEPFLTEVLPPTTSRSSARSYLAGHTNPLPNIPHGKCMMTAIRNMLNFNSVGIPCRQIEVCAWCIEGNHEHSFGSSTISLILHHLTCVIPLGTKAASKWQKFSYPLILLR